MVSERDVSALIVVDMQNDFLAKGGYYDEKEKLTRAKQGNLSAVDIDYLARVYLSPPATYEIRERYQDVVHTVTEAAVTALNTGMCTVFVRAVYDPYGQYRSPLFLLDPHRQDYGCHPGSWGADFIEPIKSLTSWNQATIVDKPTFDAFFETELCSFLRFKKISTIYIAGVETNVCVLFTVLSALSSGFKTVILTDCVSTSHTELHLPALQIMTIAKGIPMSHQDFLSLLHGGQRIAEVGG